MRFSLISVALAMVAGAFAAPTLETRQSPPTTSPARGLLCSLPIIKYTFICIPRQPNDVLINTPVGTAHGFQATANVARFAVRYAGALRWQPSIIVPVWTIPENNVTAFPKLCPQPDVDPSTYDEDCLFFVMYVPTASSATRRPITVWLHGGSNVVGGASGSGLDGSQLAEATNSIVVVAQYRLGVLGFLPPPAQGNNRNLAVRDVMNALTFLRTIAASFNGDKDKITIIGHSSGSNLVRALLAVPTAQSLFQKAIMQSDPVNYGFLSPTLQDNMRTWYYNQVSSSCSNFNTCSLSTLITVQYNLMANIMTIEPQAGTGQPLRPVKDNNLVTTSLTGSSWPSSLPKPLIMTTVKDEAGYAIYGHIPQLPSEYFPMIVTDSLGATRAEVIVESERYPYTPELSGRDDGDDTRYALQFLGTDQLWRCASWTFAREYASRGGNIWVGEFVEGVTYPINANTPYCTSGTAVCHQDEIYPVFGTSPSPTSSQSALTTMIQSRYRSFIQDSTPNPSGLATWTAATSTDVHTLRLGGGGGDAPIGQCDTSFWGSTVQYDYQAYGL